MRLLGCGLENFNFRFQHPFASFGIVHLFARVVSGLAGAIKLTFYGGSGFFSVLSLEFFQLGEILALALQLLIEAFTHFL